MDGTSHTSLKHYMHQLWTKVPERTSSKDWFMFLKGQNQFCSRRFTLSCLKIQKHNRYKNIPVKPQTLQVPCCLRKHFSSLKIFTWSPTLGFQMCVTRVTRVNVSLPALSCRNSRTIIESKLLFEHKTKWQVVWWHCFTQRSLPVWVWLTQLEGLHQNKHCYAFYWANNRK